VGDELRKQCYHMVTKKGKIGMKKYITAFLVALALLVFGFDASAQSNIAQVTTSVSGYVDAAIVVGVAVLLFVLGRKVVRKLI